MNGRQFVDTNVLIYAFDRTASTKRAAARDLIERLWLERTGCLSLQILQEFYVTATRMLSMPAADAARQVGRLGYWNLHRPTLEDLGAAIELHQKRRISFWDAMVIRSAVQLECSVLWSEDLANGSRFETLTIRNPFQMPA
jgi:predicted nucleic acid-binding protein